MQLIIELPDSISARIIDSASAANGYDPKLGLSKEDFLTNKLTELLISAAHRYESNVADQLIRKDFSDAIDNSGVLKTPKI